MLGGLKIGQRLAIGFMLLLSMMVVMALIAHQQVSEISRSLTTINDVNSLKQRYAINFRGSVHDRSIAIRDVTLVDAAELPAVTTKIAQLTANYVKSAGPLDEMMASGKGVTADEESILNSIRTTETDTLPLIDEVIRLQRAGQGAAAHTTLMTQARPKFVQWLKEINQYIDLEEAKNKAEGAHARAMANGFVWLMLGVCGSALIIGAGVAVWSLRAIRPLMPLTEVMKRMAKGDFAGEVPGRERSDEIGAMAATVEVFKTSGLQRLQLEADAKDFQRKLDARLQESEAAFTKSSEAQRHVVQTMASGLSNLAEGDLSVRLSEPVSQEYQVLIDDFNRAVSNLEAALTSVSVSVSTVGGGSRELSSASDDLARRTEQQAASLEETAAALDQITATVNKTAKGSQHAHSVAGQARADAERSGAVVRDAVEAMSAIEGSARQISQIIGVIDEIAFQTNLLALNAGVEAARAGDAGRGFAVVASEVRALAQRSAEAAKEIKALISASSQQVSTGVTLVGEAGRVLERIVVQVTEINGVVGEIAASAQEQATALNQVNTAVNQMDQVTQQNAAMVEEATAASHSLTQEAQELGRLISRFNVGQEGVVEPKQQRTPVRPLARRPALKTVGAGRGGGAVRKPEPAADESWEEF